MKTPDLVSRYKSELEFRSLAPATVYRYLRIVSWYLEHSRGVLSRATAVAFVNDVPGQTQKKLALNVLKGLFRVAGASWEFTGREAPKASAPRRPYLTIRQARALLQNASNDPLAYALLRLDMILGARREELSRMQVSDYKPGEATIKVRTAKGGQERIRKLDLDTCRILDAYLRIRRSRTEYLFVDKTGRPLSVGSLTVLFRRLADATGIPKGVGWHAIRRGVTTWLYQAGMREKELQELMGWKVATMPHNYIQLVPGQVDEMAQARHPLIRRE